MNRQAVGQAGADSGRRRRREFLSTGAGWFASIAGVAALMPAAVAATAPTVARQLLVFGDSLSAGYGMARDDSWPALLQRELTRRGGNPPWQVVNASISGETTHGGAARLEATLERVRPEVVILELGGNDALRGVPLESSRRDLEIMAQLIVQHRARLLVVGIAMPPNFGDDYQREFAGLFSTLAARHHAPLLPNLVEALGSGREDFQADGIHPQARVQPLLLASVLRRLDPLLAANGRR